MPRSLRLLKGVLPDVNEKRHLKSLALSLQKEDTKAGAEMVKKNKRKLLTTGDMVKSLDHCLTASLGKGLDAYLPLQRLEEGEQLQLAPPSLDARPLLKCVVDECAVGFAAANFLAECAGLRLMIERDPCHRDWNDAFRGIQHAGLQGAPPAEEQRSQGMQSSSGLRTSPCLQW